MSSTGSGRRTCGRGTQGPVAGDGRQDARRRDLLDLVVGHVGDVEIAGPVHGQPRGTVQVGAERAARGDLTGTAVAGEDRQRACGRHLADLIAVVVGEVDVPGTVHRHPEDIRQRVTGGRPGGDGTAARAGAGHDREDSRRVDLEHVAVPVLTDEHVPDGVHGHAGRSMEVRAGRRTGCRHSGCSAGEAGDDRQGSRRGDLLDHVVGVVGDVDVSRGVGGHAVGETQVGAGGRSGRRRAGGPVPGEDRQGGYRATGRTSRSGPRRAHADQDE